MRENSQINKSRKGIFVALKASFIFSGNSQRITRRHSIMKDAYLMSKKKYEYKRAVSIASSIITSHFRELGNTVWWIFNNCLNHSQVRWNPSFHCYKRSIKVKSKMSLTSSNGCCKMFVKVLSSSQFCANLAQLFPRSCGNLNFLELVFEF